MCGIAGIVRDDGLDVDQPLLGRMCAAIRHRGPDDDGFLHKPGVGLGMRRLAIIDLKSGQQPIHNQDRTAWIVFNGEIYNYRELRTKLEALGHFFYTNSDTEAIVHAYDQYGAECPETSSRNVCLCNLGRAHSGAFPGARSRWQEAVALRPRERPAGFWFRIHGTLPTPTLAKTSILKH